jgi:hypothetical protein
MKPGSLAPMLDRLKFTLATSGWPSLVGILLLLAAAGVELLAVPQQQALATGNQAAAERAHRNYVLLTAGDRHGKLGNAEALAHFRERLRSDQEADAIFEILQRDAQKNGLVPASTEYKWQRQSSAGLAEVSIVMPLKAAYAPLRGFVKDVLADVPGLALDQFNLQRDNISASVVDAHLRFSLYLKTGK